MIAATPLLPHQVPAVEKLRRLRVGAAFMEMGTGKTRVALQLAILRWGRIRRLIWLCPVSLKQSTAREVLKHVPTAKVYIFDEKTEAGKIPEADIYICGIESISSSVRVISALNSICGPDSMVVADESTTIKGHRAQRTKWATVIGKKARYRLILTGTPITRDVSDLFSQMLFLDEKILGYRSWYAFDANHLERHPTKKFVVRAHNLDWLAAKVAPFVYQCTKAECLDLPQKLYSSRWCSATVDQRELYESAREKLLEEIYVCEEWRESTLVYRLFGALQQIACGFWNEIHRDGTNTLHTVAHDRYEAVADAINLIPDGERIIIWTKYLRCAGELKDLYPAAGLHTGSESARDRDRAVQAWKAGTSPILIATPATGGYGLNLTEGAYAIYHSNGMKWSERVQSEDRIHRIGQLRPPTYVNVGVSGTIDERVQSLLDQKSGLADDWRNRVQRIRDKHGRMQALKELVV